MAIRPILIVNPIDNEVSFTYKDNGMTIAIITYSAVTHSVSLSARPAPVTLTEEQLSLFLQTIYLWNEMIYAAYGLRATVRSRLNVELESDGPDYKFTGKVALPVPGFTFSGRWVRSTRSMILNPWPAVTMHFSDFLMFIYAHAFTRTEGIN